MNKKIFLYAGIIVLMVLVIFLVFKVLTCGRTSCGIPGLGMSEEFSLLDKGRKFMAGGDDDSAMKNFETLAAKYPEAPETEGALAALASIYAKRGDLLKSKEIYQRIVEKFPASNDTLKTQETLEGLNIKILFSSIITPDSVLYEVQKGDTLTKIAKKFGTTVELISKANSIKNANIRIGKKLKISKAKFSVVVDKSQNILTLKADGNILKAYRVATGKNFSTPTGNFTITTKVVDPPWYTDGAVIAAGSPNNILGSRWLGISKPGYGIHGTTDPKSIGQQATAGCVRMRNEDVEELYAIAPEGTEVVIVD